MDAKTVAMLKTKGWRVGSAREFLGASVAMERFVDTRLNLRRAMIEARKARDWTQTQLAEAMGTTQSRVAQIEGGDPSTSTDLLLRALYAMDLTREEVGAAVARKFVEIGETIAVSDHWDIKKHSASGEGSAPTAPLFVKRGPACRRTSGRIAAKKSGRIHSKAKSTAGKRATRKT